MPMKRFSIISTILVIFSLYSFAQKDVMISGGNAISATVSANGEVWVWGSNKIGTSTGLLGIGSSSAAVTYPQRVTYFSNNGITVKQVSCGTGLHFAALDCEGKVYCWGNNSLGQCGTGTIANTDGVVQTTPVQVELGTSELASTEYDDGNGYLCNVDVVYAGCNNTFAILGDGPYKGCLVGWGGNNKGFDSNGYDDAYGQLGCGNQMNQAYPVFVVDALREKLQGVVQVAAGDNCAYALVDPDGDGVGTIYSWGHEKNNGALGRGQNGGAGSPSAKTSPYAYPVSHADNSSLDNIIQLAAGDMTGFGLDVDGYIWAWGNGAWNNAAGVLDANYTWYGDGANYSTPLRVRKGLTTGASNDGTYLLAKSVAGGQGYGMAITADNKPVAWGGGGCGDGGGGATGSKIGQSSSNAGPEYIKYSSNGIHDDVLFINRGDTWGFYGRSDGSVWAWGCNDYGQLGIGSTQAAAYATGLNPPTGSSFKDPLPTAFISPSEITACAASAFEGVTLDCGFHCSKGSLINSYTITWYKDGEMVHSGYASPSNRTYTTPVGEAGIGTYRVVVRYVGTNSGCSSYDDAEDEITISALQQEFSIPSLTYCGDEATVNVTPSNSTAEYTWYANQSATTELGKSIGDEEITIDISGVSALQGDKTIYVQETSMGSGLFLPENSSNWKNGMLDNINGTISNTYATGFSVNEPITLTSVSCYTNAYLYVAGNESATLTFTVYGAKTYNGGYIPNTSEEYGSFVGTKDVTSTNQNSEKLTATGSVSLPVGMYFIVPTNLERSDASVQFGLRRGNSSLATTNVDNITGTILQFQSVANGSIPNVATSGYIFDITFTAGQKYCGVVPVTLSQDCPALPIDIIFDDCDDGDEITNTGGYWFTFNDKDNKSIACEPGTLSSITPYVDSDELFVITPAIMSEFGYDGTGYAVHATYTLGTNYTPYSGNSCAPWVNPAYCGVGTQVGEDAASTVDWSAGTGISFWYKGSSSLFTVAISEVEDTDFHRYTVPECTEWTKITVLWSDLEQQSWGTEVTFSAKHIQKLMWEINTSYSGSEGSTGEIWIDKLCVFGLDPIELTALTIQPVHDSDLTLQNLSPNINPSAIPIASGAAGDTLYLETILTPTDATYPVVIWSSSDEEVATVDSKGRVIGVSEGTATITARSKTYSEIFATFSVEVKIPCTTPDAPAVVDATYCYGDTPQELSVLASPDGSLMWYEAATGSTVHVESSQDVIGGAKSMHGSFYTFDNGVQTKAQLGDKAANVVFCFLTLDENKETLDVFRFISGTEAVNEIVQSQASETKFVMISDATQEEFEIVDWSEGTTSIDIAKTLEAGQKVVAFKNALSEGFFEVVSYDENAEDLTINVWKIEHAAPYNESTASTTAPMPNTEKVGKTTYYVSQIVNGCESEKAPIAVTVNELPSVSISADKDEVCAGETITLTADADDSGTFTWSGDGVTENGNTATVTAMSTTAESITVTLNYVSEYNCEAQASATVTFLPVPTAPTTEDVSYCQSETAEMLTATASEGATLLWYESEKSVVASTKAPVPSTATAGDTTYYVSQIVNGCESEKTAVVVTVNELPRVGITADKDEVCLGETVTLTANAEDGDLAWSGGITSTEKTVTFAPTETNLVSLKITNESGCESEASTTITVKPIPESPIAQSVTYCQNAVAQILTATADGEQKWYIGGEASTTAPVPSTATAGDTTYYVSQTVNGCESEKTAVVVTINELPTVSITANKTEICAGETVILTANAEDGDFAWSGGVTSTEKTMSFAPTETTSVSLTVTNEFGCESEALTTITVKAIPEKPIAQSVSYCQNAVAQILTAIADGEQKWYIGDEASTTAPVPNTATVGDTTYYVSQIVNGCESEKTAIKVTVSELPSVGITANKTEICAGEAVTLTANAEDGDFAWSGGVTSTEKTVSFAPTETTSVSVTFTNESGCESEASTTITVNAIPEKPVAQSVTYYQNAEAQILTAIADGKLKWYIGDEASATAPVPSTAAVGETTYYVSQIVNGCESEKAAITVSVKSVPVVPIAEIPDVAVDEEGQVTTIELSDYFAGGESEEIVYTVTSSDPSIVYPVTRGDELEFVQYGSGTVTITVTATVGTTVTSQTFTITVNPKPDQPTKPCELTVEPTITNVTCFGGEDGKIEVAVSGGVEPYTYKWNTGRTSKGIYAMAAGEYSILVRDSLGCTTTSAFTIEEPAEMSVIEEITNPSCGISDGSIAITIEGGTAPYTQRWYSGNGTIMESLENLQGDVYEVVIIDKNSCKLRKTYSLQESGAPSVSLKSVNASKCNEATGSCEIAVSSESEYTIVWSDATEATTEKSRSGMLPGTYTVTVNDAENCRSILSVTIPTETFRQPEIALVTVGEESGKNLVVWQKPETDMIAFYTVYREGDESGVYDKLGDVDFHETSIFVDPDANIMEQSWRYKISATDVCGNESPLSKEHKTIHLQKARGLDGEINLIWDSYEGIAYASYCLYRQTKSGSGLEMFKKVPASLNRYTDMNPPADVKGYYVAVVLPTEINENEPLKAESGPFALAISNIAEVENDGDIDAVDAVENDAVVYANGKNIVVLNANGKNVTINDITGRTIAQEKAVQSTVIPVQQVGVYLVTIGDKVQKVVVE